MLIWLFASSSKKPQTRRRRRRRESTLSISQVFECHEAFSEGREVVENFPHASRPSTSVHDDKIEKVKKIVLENRRVSIREVAEAFNISYGST